MSCCSSSSSLSEKKPSKRHNCPQSGTECLQVPYLTVLQHIKKPWDTANGGVSNENTYYFCNNSICEVVYFTEDDSVINKEQLRTLVGIKELENDDALACYCFDITLAEARNNNKLKQFVIDKTKNGFCSCESQNPAGKCCLKDFPIESL